MKNTLPFGRVFFLAFYKNSSIKTTEIYFSVFTNSKIYNNETERISK